MAPRGSRQSKDFYHMEQAPEHTTPTNLVDHYYDDDDDDDDEFDIFEGFDLESDDQNLYSTSLRSHHRNNNANSNTNTSMNDVRERLIQKEERSVRFWRISVVVGVVLTALGLTFAVYYFAQRAQETNFRVEYEAHAHDLVESVQWEVRYNRALLEHLAASLTALGHAFPQVTDPHFPGLVDLSGMTHVLFAPLVTQSERSDWEAYAHQKTQDVSAAANNRMSPSIYTVQEGARVPAPENDDIYLPVWQSSPAHPVAVNFNLLSHPVVADLFHVVQATQQSVVSSSILLSKDPVLDFVVIGGQQQQQNNDDNNRHGPHALVMAPVFDTLPQTHDNNNNNSTATRPQLVGVTLGILPIETLLDDLLPAEMNGMVVVWKDACGNDDTFLLRGAVPYFAGATDAHDAAYDGYRIQSSPNVESYTLQDKLGDAPTTTNATDAPKLCPHQLDIYPSAELQDDYESARPFLYAAVVLAVFVWLATLLGFYDVQVTRRQQKTMSSLLRTDQFIAKLFPDTVRRRVVEEDTEHNFTESPSEHNDAFSSSMRKSVAGGLGMDEDGLFTSKPIADFFPETTIMFGDIAGFTAWASAREPHQVFILLETLYGAFDAVAKRRRVFKVETVGDCYVAVVGLPTPRRDHAVAMARFASDCLDRMKEWTHKLELQLGPDTADLKLRVGLHSGAVTGGVLRGENSRFQLFGDSMNTCARIETTGQPGRIHASQEVADSLRTLGKGAWVTAREETVIAKGKGELQTYWIQVHKASRDASTSNHSGGDQREDCSNPSLMHFSDGPRMRAPDNKLKRLVEWNVDILSRFLVQIQARRIAQGTNRQTIEEDQSSWFRLRNKTIDEVCEVIALPPLPKNAGRVNMMTINVNEKARDQLRQFLLLIATMYHDNPFHNFEHASHVTMSVIKLLSRIIAPSNVELDNDALLHDTTYGITSDPLTQFACIFSAIIHDLDHPGVPNSQIIREQSVLANHYGGKSVAEQNSVDLAWTLLMGDDYADLRHAIYQTKAEAQRFRQLVVNSVMATDIMDKDLKKLRNGRWEKAFSDPRRAAREDPQKVVNRKATIVIEHLIQASDVAHTMQHWHVYRKWNERLFQECYKAYQQGRADKNPTDGWYKGELGFFDYYIIPLAKKLKDCGVFGVSSDEYLAYAQKNRAEWELKGQGLVAEMIQNLPR